MKVERPDLSPAEIKAEAEAWFANQITTLERCHGADWPRHQEWLESYLKEELRQRLIAIGWRPKR